jgi:hypothetical protein
MHTIRLRFEVIVAVLWIFGIAQFSVVAAAGGADARTLNPNQALAQLMAGNQRFQNDATGRPLFDAKRNREDAEEAFTLLSMIHKRIDAARTPARA